MFRELRAEYDPTTLVSGAWSPVETSPANPDMGRSGAALRENGGGAAPEEVGGEAEDEEKDGYG